MVLWELATFLITKTMERQWLSSPFLLCTSIVVAYANFCRTKFDSQYNVCPTFYGTTLNRFYKVPSALECSLRSSEDENCNSFIYNPTTKICQTNSGELVSFPTGCSSNVAAVYGKLIKGTCQADWLHNACTANIDCTVANSACYNNVCDCLNGYSYWQRKDSCHAGCTVWGSTFKEEEMYLEGLNDDIQVKPTSAQCQSLCINTWGNTCRTIEYVISMSQCLISSHTGLTRPAAYKPESNSDYRQWLRNCEKP